MPRKISLALQNQVRQRAGYLCEYCHASELWQYVRFTVDHVLPVGQGGIEDFGNLALACFFCNRRKSNKIAVWDKLTGRTVELFNPRRHEWANHFAWSANSLEIIPLTATGRVTVELFDFNRERLQRIRQADVSVSRHPPVNDPILPF